MNLRTSIAMVAAISGFVVSSPGARITGLYNTGVDEHGNVLSLHSVEQHYTLSGLASVAYVIPPVWHNDGSGLAYVPAPAGSAWIGPNPTASTWPTDPAGNYYYTLKIDVNLSGHNLSQVQIAGRWATDNSGQIYLNGEYTGFNTGEWGFVGLSSFFIQSGFVDGINTLEFRVLNSFNSPNPSPTGLLVADLRGVDDGSLPIPPVLEHASWVTTAFLFLPFGLHYWRRCRQTRQS